MCPNDPGPNCGCPAAWMAQDCTWLVDPDCPECMNDSGVPIGSGLLAFIGSAAVYGFILKGRKQNKQLRV